MKKTFGLTIKIKRLIKKGTSTILKGKKLSRISSNRN